MLSAVRTVEALDMSNTDPAASSPSGFGNVLNSLQGLQQRLEDFSISDVTSAETNARTLIQCIEKFQATIAAVARLKIVVAIVNQSIAEVQQVDTARIDMASLENHPQLHAIVKVGKLIKMQKLMTALNAGNDVGGSQKEQIFEPVTETITTVERSRNLTDDIFVTTTLESVGQECVTKSQGNDDPAPRSTAFDSVPARAMATVRDAVIEFPSIKAPICDIGPLDKDALADFPTAQAEFEIAIAAVTADSALAQAHLPDFPVSAEEPNGDQVIVEPPSVELAMNLPQPAKPKQDAPRAAVKRSKTRNNEPRRAAASKALIPASESFDLRLLDDLVSNYGEFASNPNLPATINKKDLQPVEAAATEHLRVQPEHSSSIETPASLATKHGDLDRQLKKIIKDYGEYDLYSDKQTTNIKKAGILAFLFLGLVFGGIYFFKAPPSTAKTAPAAVNSSSTTLVDPQSWPHAPENNADRRDTAFGPTHEKEKPAATNK